MEFSTTGTILQPILENGREGILEAVKLLLNEAMRLERSQALNSGHYERSSARVDYANGYKPKTVQSAMGEMTLDIPQTRSGGFYPSCLEKGLRSDRALNLALAEMYVNGVSTRKVTNILEKMCGLEGSSMQVIRAAKMLDEEFESWRTRPIGRVRYLLLDARYEKVRVDRTVRDCALLIAYGIRADGSRSVLGVSVKLSESEVHWRKFLSSPAERNLSGLATITSDSHAGLAAARMSVFPSVPWQRCQFHLQQNASAYVPKKAMREEVHDDIRNIFNMPTKEAAERLLKLSAAKYREKASDLSAWLESELPEGFMVFEAAPAAARRKLRTTNMVEFQNKELKKRTRCIRVFPNKESLLRVATALLIELDETWQTESKAYIAI